MSGINQRRYPRVNYPCSLTVWPTHEDHKVIFANTANVGAGGLFVHLNEKILPGSRVEIKIEFPGDTPSFKCFGTVLRCQGPAEEGGRRFFALAVQFEPMPQAQQERLKSIVDTLSTQEGKNNA